ncbi:hypothetical protein T265_12425, partial [Opisthorchis viverrini]
LPHVQTSHTVTKEASEQLLLNFEDHVPFTPDNAFFDLMKERTAVDKHWKRNGQNFQLNFVSSSEDHKNGRLPSVHDSVYLMDMKENALLDAKAGAVAGILFLQDDLFAYQRMAKMNKDAIMKQPMTVQEQEEMLEALMPASFALKAYLRNNDRQIARLALLASLEPITM